MKKVLFVCVENSCRSQMAEGWARHLGEGALEAYSAGSKPSGTVNPDAVKVMAESGVDISGQGSKGFFDLPVKEFDYVVTMGCKDVCPFVPAGRHIEWQIEDPKGKDLDNFRKARDVIKMKVTGLIETLKGEE
jgi:arsenate reductase